MKNNLKNNLKEARLKRKLTQQQVCDLCGIKFTQEYMIIESGKRLPRVDKAIRIARALKKKVEDIWII